MQVTYQALFAVTLVILKDAHHSFQALQTNHIKSQKLRGLYGWDVGYDPILAELFTGSGAIRQQQHVF